MEPGYIIRWTEQALVMLEDIRDRRVRRLLLEAGKGLVRDPDKQGKPMIGSLGGLRSLRVAGQRYRLLYRVRAKEIRVYVAAVGLRKDGDRNDIYVLAQRLLRLGLLP